MKLQAHWQMLIALVSAALLGLLLRSQDGAFVEGLVGFCDFIGKLFMSLLKMIIVPLVVSSVIVGIASLQGVKGFGRLLGKTAGFYALTSFLAICLGLLLVNFIQPGLVDGAPNESIREAFASQEVTEGAQAKVEAARVRSMEEKEPMDQLKGFFLRMVPSNIFAAAANNGQMLGLIFFSICFAIAMTRLPTESVAPLRKVFDSINEVMIVLTHAIMALAPIGVFGLIVPVVYQTGGGLFLSLGKYFITVLLALGLHLFVVMPLVIRFLAGVSPWAHLRAMKTALLTAFSTASSSATLPITLRCIQEEVGVSKKTASFTLPLGATVNMDGTALYECVAVIFVAQVMGFEMSFTAQFMVVLSALLTRKLPLLPCSQLTAFSI